MPLYAYTCTACSHSFDIQQSFTDSSLTVCPECSGLLRKVFSAVGVVFKGSGFYRTDNKATKKGSSSSASAKDKDGSGSSSNESSSKDSSGTTASSGSKDSAAPSTTSGSAASGSGTSTAKPAAAAAAK